MKNSRNHLHAVSTGPFLTCSDYVLQLSEKKIKKSSPLKLLSQSQPNFAKSVIQMKFNTYTIEEKYTKYHIYKKTFYFHTNNLNYKNKDN
jgi:hypothetical protein